MSAEVWAAFVAFEKARSVLTVVFSNTPAMCRSPVCLSLWAWQVNYLSRGKMTPQTAVEATLQQWISGDPQIGQVRQLVRQAEAGLDLFGFDVQVDRRLLGPNFDVQGHNDSMFWLDLRGRVPAVLGPVPTQEVALARLTELFSRGARPALGMRLQAHTSLYEQELDSGHPAVALFTFDPAVQPEYLEDLADYIYDIDEEETEDPVLLAAVAVPLANQEEWRYCRRGRIPVELTRGHVIYAGDIWVHRPFLVDGYFSDRQPRAMPLLADPGESGGLELIPYDRIGHFWPGTQGNAFRPQT